MKGALHCLFLRPCVCYWFYGQMSHHFVDDFSGRDIERRFFESTFNRFVEMEFDQFSCFQLSFQRRCIDQRFAEYEVRARATKVEVFVPLRVHLIKQELLCKRKEKVKWLSEAINKQETK